MVRRHQIACFSLIETPHIGQRVAAIVVVQPWAHFMVEMQILSGGLGIFRGETNDLDNGRIFELIGDARRRWKGSTYMH